MTAARDETAGGHGGDRDGLPGPATDAQMNAVSDTVPIRRQAHGVRKDLNPPRESLTDPRDEETLTFDAPGRSWECPIWGMSDERGRHETIPPVRVVPGRGTGRVGDRERGAGGRASTFTASFVPTAPIDS